MKRNSRNRKTRKKSLCGVVLLILLMLPSAVLAAEAGWQQTEGKWYYYTEEGQPLTSCLTPDGYLVDADGIWTRQKTVILDKEIDAAEKFIPSSQMAGWSSILEEMNWLNGEIQKVLNGKRIFHIYEDSISYCRVASGKETELLGLYKNEETDGYLFKISTDLGNRLDDRTQAATYDYNVFKLFCSGISGSPEVLADAIYSSWQGNNAYQITKEQRTPVGDAAVCCMAENGAGYYDISQLR